MPTFIVRAVDRESGETSELILAASSPEAARTIAYDRGMVVETVAPVRNRQSNLIPWLIVVGTVTVALFVVLMISMLPDKSVGDERIANGPNSDAPRLLEQYNDVRGHTSIELRLSFAGNKSTLANCTQHLYLFETIPGKPRQRSDSYDMDHVYAWFNLRTECSSGLADDRIVPLHWLVDGKRFTSYVDADMYGKPRGGINLKELILISESTEAKFQIGNALDEFIVNDEDREALAEFCTYFRRLP